ncbi:MAG: hypothetical protein JW798_08540 [Prolixibacteraceae bacterium]|nr:hypothetical protein [Prolixibacteraceae bacterium]
MKRLKPTLRLKLRLQKLTLFALLLLFTTVCANAQKLSLGISDQLTYFTTLNNRFRYTNDYETLMNLYGLNLKYTQSDSSIVNYSLGIYTGYAKTISVPFEVSFNLGKHSKWSAGLGVQYFTRYAWNFYLFGDQVNDFLAGCSFNRLFFVTDKLESKLSVSFYHGLIMYSFYDERRSENFDYYNCLVNLNVILYLKL